MVGDSHILSVFCFIITCELLHQSCNFSSSALIRWGRTSGKGVQFWDSATGRWEMFNEDTVTVSTVKSLNFSPGTNTIVRLKTNTVDAWSVGRGSLQVRSWSAGETEASCLEKGTTLPSQALLERHFDGGDYRFQPLVLRKPNLSDILFLIHAFKWKFRKGGEWNLISSFLFLPFTSFFGKWVFLSSEVETKSNFRIWPPADLIDVQKHIYIKI